MPARTSRHPWLLATVVLAMAVAMFMGLPVAVRAAVTSLTISPEEGPPGTIISYQGTAEAGPSDADGLPSVEVTLSYTKVDGTTDTVSDPDGPFTSSSFSDAITLPPDARQGTSATVEACDADDGGCDSNVFTVTGPVGGLTPKFGPPGQNVRIQLSGFNDPSACGDVEISIQGGEVLAVVTPTFSGTRFLIDAVIALPGDLVAGQRPTIVAAQDEPSVVCTSASRPFAVLQFVISPTTGSPGTVVEVSGSGWFNDPSPPPTPLRQATTCDEVDILFGSTLVATLSVVDGEFTGTFAVPNFPPGTYNVTARQPQCEFDGSTPSMARQFVIPGQPDRPPVARDDSVAISFQTPVTIDVLANDSDPDGNLDPATLAVIDPPEHGEASVVDGEIRYIPDDGYSGPDEFAYEVCDTTQLCDSAVVFVRVAGARPIARTDFASTIFPDPVTVDVLANDSDPDGQLVPASLRVVPASVPSGADAAVVDGQIRYTPADPGGAQQQQRFSYEICDDDGLCDQAEVVVTVAPPEPQPPVLQPDFASTPHATPVTVDVLANDSDPDGQIVPQTLEIVGPRPVGATVVVTSDFRIQVDPDEGVVGDVVVDYSVRDDDGLAGDPARLTVTVGAGDNAPPIALPDAVTLAVDDGPVTIDVLANDSDPDGPGGQLQPSDLVITVPPDLGTAEVVTGFLVRYTPTAAGTTSFSYTVADDRGASDSAEVAVTVNPAATPTPTAPPSPPATAPEEPEPPDDDEEEEPTETETREENEPPEVVPDRATVAPGDTVTIPVLGNDSDPDGELDPDSLALVTRPSVGTARVEGRVVEYTAPPEARDIVVFSYRVCDDDGACGAAAVSVTIEDGETPTEFPTDPDEPTCEDVRPSVEGLALESDLAGPGETVSVTVTFGVVPADCPFPGEVEPLRLGFDGEPVGGPFLPAEGGTTTSFVVPEGAAPGDHEVSVIGAGGAQLAVASVTVPGAPEGGFPWWLVALAAAAAAAAAFYYYSTREGGVPVVIEGTPAGQPPADVPAVPAAVPLLAGDDDDPCAGLREDVAQAAARMDAARQGVDQATERVLDGQDRLAQARSAFEQCAQAGERALPVEGAVAVRPEASEDAEAWPGAAAARAVGGLLSTGLFRGRRREQYLLLDDATPTRTAPLRGIVIDFGPPHAGPTARSVAEGLAADRVDTAHVVVGADGIVPLLPDEGLANWNGRHDADTLTALVAGWHEDSDRGADILANLARWVRGRADRHAIPPVRVDATQWHLGASGLLGAWDLEGSGELFPWRRLEELVRGAAPTDDAALAVPLGLPRLALGAGAGAAAVSADRKPAAPGGAKEADLGRLADEGKPGKAMDDMAGKDVGAGKAMGDMAGKDVGAGKAMGDMAGKDVGGGKAMGDMAGKDVGDAGDVAGTAAKDAELAGRPEAGQGAPGDSAPGDGGPKADTALKEGAPEGPGEAPGEAAAEPHRVHGRPVEEDRGAEPEPGEVPEPGEAPEPAEGVEPAEAVAAPGAVQPSTRAAGLGEGPCAAEQADMDAARSEVETAQADLRTAQAELEAAAEAESATRLELHQCLIGDNADIPVAGAGVVPAEREHIGTWYLLEHQNPNAPARANGKSGWYYPARTGFIQGVVVHSAEALDLEGADTSAEGVARYFTTVSRPASAHVAIDTDSTVYLLPDSAVAFHAAGGNTSGLGIEICYQAARWGAAPDFEELLLRRSAGWCRLKVMTYQIPVRRLTRAQWEAGERGFVAHADLDPARRTDPGPNFPWDRFLAMIGAAAPQQEPSGVPWTYVPEVSYDNQPLLNLSLPNPIQAPARRAAAIGRHFGFSGVIHGFGGRPGPSDHPNGLALDFMTNADRALGEVIAQYFVNFRHQLDVKYVIFNERIWSDRENWAPRPYKVGTDDTTAHRDHPHISFRG